MEEMLSYRHFALRVFKANPYIIHTLCLLLFDNRKIIFIHTSFETQFRISVKIKSTKINRLKTTNLNFNNYREIKRFIIQE